MRRFGKKGIFRIVGLLLVVILILDLFISNNVIQVTRYTVEADVENPIRIVQLTDLHNKQFGKENKRLIRKVKEQDPDYIFMTGDMISQNDELDRLLSLLRNLTDIAPVYYSYGNHEKEWEKNHLNQDLKKQLQSTGTLVLDDDYIDVELNGNPVRLAGMYGYYRRPVMTTKNPTEKERIIQWCQELENTERYKILLSHIPTPWLDWDFINGYPKDISNSEYYDGKHVDLVFSGHYHGGQIRIPGIGGLFAPYVRWFPEYTKGLFIGKETTCALSAGLGSYGGIPRVMNRPEIVTVILE